MTTSHSPEQETIEKLPDKKIRKIRSLPKNEQKDVEWLIDAIGASGLEEFMEYIRSPWKMLWPNFVAGVARGFGALVGAALVIGIIGWTLSKIIDLPLIGQRLEPYVKQVQSEINKYTEATNYKTDYFEMNNLLKEIRDELRAQKNLPK